MNKPLKNAKAVRIYIEYLRNAKRRSESTITAVERALTTFEQGIKGADFADFNRRIAMTFTEWLEEEGRTGSGTSAKQMYSVLRHVRAFLLWLAFRPGYKSRIAVDDIEYLSMDRQKLQEARATNLVDWPSKEHVLKLVDSIEGQSELAMRDRALISLLFLSGMRDSAVASLPLGCFDPEKLEIHQSPAMGVHTKFGKDMVTHLFVFDDRLSTLVLDWYNYLKDQKLFSSRDPLFPRNKVVRNSETGAFESVVVERAFWQGAGPIRDIVRRRSEAAGLPYYKPHAFRHATAQLAAKQCASLEELRVVSQNLGHENVGTTLTSYGKVSPGRVREVMSTVDFARSGNELFDADFKRKLNLLVNQPIKELDK